MTLTTEIYDKINNEFLAILEKYSKNDAMMMTEFDLLSIAANLLASYMEVILRGHGSITEDEILTDVIDLIKMHRAKFVSRN